MKANIFIVTFCSFFILSADLVSQERQLIGRFKDWYAYTYKKTSEKVCYVTSKPILSDGGSSERSGVWIIIESKPKQKRDYKFRFIAGYRYPANCDTSDKPECQVTLKFDNKKEFKLYTEKTVAWSYEKADDLIVNSMHRESKVTITGKSQRGEETTDTFSLLGFSKAMRVLNKACK